MRLRHEARDAAVALAYVEHPVAEAVALVAESLVAGYVVVEDVRGQVEVVRVNAVYDVVAQVGELVRATHVRAEGVQDVVALAERREERAVRAVYHVGALRSPKVQFPFKEINT